jgi:hypothetical protein
MARCRGVRELAKSSGCLGEDAAPMCISVADFNGDGQVDGNDSTDDVADYGAPDARADVDFDGDVDINDSNMFSTAYDSGDGEARGRAALSRTNVANRMGYAGYQWDPSITARTPRWRVRSERGG